MYYYILYIYIYYVIIHLQLYIITSGGTYHKLVHHQTPFFWSYFFWLDLKCPRPAYTSLYSNFLHSQAHLRWHLRRPNESAVVFSTNDTNDNLDNIMLQVLQVLQSEKKQITGFQDTTNDEYIYIYILYNIYILTYIC